MSLISLPADITSDGPSDRSNAFRPSTSQSWRTSFSSLETLLVTHRHLSVVRLVLIFFYQADPVTPFVSAQVATKMLGDRAVLVEQLGVGHVSVAQFSSCTMGIVANFVVNNQVSSLFSQLRGCFLILGTQLPVAPSGGHIKCEVDSTNVLFPPIDTSTPAKRDIGPLVRWR